MARGGGAFVAWPPLFVCLFRVCLFVFVCLFVCLFGGLFVCLSVCFLFFCFFVCLFLFCVGGCWCVWDGMWVDRAVWCVRGRKKDGRATVSSTPPRPTHNTTQHTTHQVAMRLITFLPAATHQAPPRWHALGNAMAIKPKVGPKDGYPHNAFLLKSLGQALHDTGSMALVRCVLVCLPSLPVVCCLYTDTSLQVYNFSLS